MLRHGVETLKPFFNPNSVAVIGASAKTGTIGNVIFRNFLKQSFKGKAYPVNPKYDYVQKVKCYPSVKDIPDRIDLAVVAIPAPAVLKVIRECAEKGVKAALIISGGFSETGSEGVEREEELKRIVEETGIRIIGPNCLGIYDAVTGVDSVFLPDIKCSRPPKGKIAFITQSGAFGGAVLDWLSIENIGLSKCVSYGNACDVNEVDLLEYLAEDENTKVITMYLEGIKNGRRFIETARKVARSKPIVAIKAGRTERGTAAVQSHTGSLAGSDQIIDAVFKQSGIIRANDFQDMFDMAKALAMQPPAKGNRILIITNGGGAGVMTTDACEMNGIEVPEVPEETQNFLKKHFPQHCSTHNPIDLTGDTDAERYELALRHAATLEIFNGGVIVIALFQTPLLTLEISNVITDFAKEIDKPIICCIWGGKPAQVLRENLNRNGVPAYPTPERAVKAMYALYKYSKIQQKIAKLNRYAQPLL
ncbi:CoA-binding protein [Candidatus Bathyarchaeota archaeon]|nr:MAG: CoA-binding protein [Candidatus Bathyarchaeota archaeon]